MNETRLVNDTVGIVVIEPGLISYMRHTPGYTVHDTNLDQQLHGVLNNNLSDLPCRLIQDQSKVVLKWSPYARQPLPCASNVLRTFDRRLWEGSEALGSSKT